MSLYGLSLERGDPSPAVSTSDSRLQDAALARILYARQDRGVIERLTTADLSVPSSPW
jgi:hypothetical protein